MDLFSFTPFFLHPLLSSPSPFDVAISLCILIALWSLYVALSDKYFSYPYLSKLKNWEAMGTRSGLMLSTHQQEAMYMFAVSPHHFCAGCFFLVGWLDLSTCRDQALEQTDEKVLDSSQLLRGLSLLRLGVLWEAAFNIYDYFSIGKSLGKILMVKVLRKWRTKKTRQKRNKDSNGAKDVVSSNPSNTDHANNNNANNNNNERSWMRRRSSGTPAFLAEFLEPSTCDWHVPGIGLMGVHHFGTIFFGVGMIVPLLPDLAKVLRFDITASNKSTIIPLGKYLFIQYLWLTRDSSVAGKSN